MSFSIRQHQYSNMKLCVRTSKSVKKKKKPKKICKTRRWFYHCRGEYATLMNALEYFVFRFHKRYRRSGNYRSAKLNTTNYDGYKETRWKYQEIITKFQCAKGSNKLMVKGFVEALKNKSQEGFLYEKKKFECPVKEKVKLIKNFLVPQNSEAVIFSYLESADV